MKRLFIIVLLISLFLAGMVLSVILYTESEEQTIQNQFKQQEIYAQQAVISIDNFFDTFKHSLQFLSESEKIINFTESSEIYIKNYFEAHIDEIKAITRISADGKIIYTYPFVESVIGKDVSNQAHNRAIQELQKPVISDVFKAVQGYRAIVYAHPIFKDGEYDGCISILIPFNYIAKKFLKEIKIGKSGSSFVVSEKGYELFCDEEQHVGKKISEKVEGFATFENMIENMLNRQEGTAEYTYISKKNKDEVQKMAVYKYVELENTFWSLAVIRDTDEVLASHRSFITKLSILLVIISIVVILFLYFIARERRKSRMQIMEKEIKYKNDLEKLVEVRTEELNLLNKSLQGDIAKRKIIEAELKQAIERVEKSEKIKSEFLAQMSHEIRTPINTILSFSSLIKEELSQHAGDDLIYGFSGIQNAGKRLIRTIDLILNMSDLQLGTHEYIPKETDICEEIIKNLEVEYRVQIIEKKLDLKIKKQTENTRIVCDSYSVNQIFANLIDNAIKYTPKGTIEIVCSQNANEELQVSVNDTGVGISEEYLPHIFDEFSQEDKGYTRKFEGNGLGLALVKKYCALNSAKINVESKKGKGSKFIVTFKSF